MAHAPTVKPTVEAQCLKCKQASDSWPSLWPWPRSWPLPWPWPWLWPWSVMVMAMAKVHGLGSDEGHGQGHCHGHGQGQLNVRTKAQHRFGFSGVGRLTNRDPKSPFGQRLGVLSIRWEPVLAAQSPPGVPTCSPHGLRLAKWLANWPANWPASLIANHA